MGPKSRKSNRTSCTDLPASITNNASTSFEEYLRSRKRQRNQDSDADTTIRPTNKSANINPGLEDNDIFFSNQYDTAEDNNSNIDPTSADDIPSAEQENETDSENTDQTTAHQREEKLIKLMSKGLKYAASWSNVLSFLSVTGRTRFSREQYKIFQDAIKSSSNSADNLLSYSSVRENQTKYFNMTCFPESTIIWIPCTSLRTTLSGNITKTLTAEGHMKDVRECVKIVMPSAWAKYDMSLYPTHSDIIEGTHVSDVAKLSIERSPIVNGREYHIGNSSSFWSMYKGNLASIDIGTLISIPVNDCLSADSGLSSWATTTEKDKHAVVCKTGPQWCVSTPKYKSNYQPIFNYTDLSADERKVYDYLKDSELTFEEFNDIEDDRSISRNKRPSKKSQTNSLRYIEP